MRLQGEPRIEGWLINKLLSHRISEKLLITAVHLPQSSATDILESCAPHLWYPVLNRLDKCTLYIPWIYNTYCVEVLKKCNGNNKRGPMQYRQFQKTGAHDSPYFREWLTILIIKRNICKYVSVISHSLTTLYISCTCNICFHYYVFAIEKTHTLKWQPSLENNSQHRLPLHFPPRTQIRVKSVVRDGRAAHCCPFMAVTCAKWEVGIFVCTVTF